MTATVQQSHTRARVRLAGPRLDDPRLLVAAVIVSVQVLGQVSLGFALSISQILVAIGTCVLVDLAVQLRRGATVLSWPASAMLTGNGIALILRVPGTEHGDWWAMRGWWVFAGMSLAAMASKHLLRFDSRHLFNPSNAALVLGFLLLPETLADPQDLWWGPLGVGLVLTYAIVVAGGYIVSRRLRLWDVVLPFFAAYGLLMALNSIAGGCLRTRWSLDPVCGLSYWQTLVLSPEILIFALFMITDPATVPRGRRPRIGFAVLVATTSALAVSFTSTEYAAKVAVLSGLVVGCAARPLLERTLKQPANGRRSTGPLRIAASVAVGCAVVAMVLQDDAGSRPPEPDDVGVMSARSEAQIEPEVLPQVRLSSEVERVAAGLEGDVAQEMLVDLAVDLELARLAVERGDPDLARAAGVGDWLEALLKDVANPESAREVATSRYAFASAEIVVLGERLSPQSLPPLAMRVEGTAQTAGSGPTPFSATFTLTRKDGHFLVSADDLEGSIEPAAVPSETVSFERFSRAVRIGTDVDEGSVEGQVPLFDDVTDEAGIDMDTTAATLSSVPVPSADAAEAMIDSVPVWTALMNSQTYFGTGQAWGDVNGDDLLDLYLTNQDGPNALLLNQGDGGFAPAPPSLSKEVLLPDEASGGATWVDFDNDGWSDLHVLHSGGGHLFRNVNGRALEDVTQQAGIAGRGKGMTASWADFDGDADLDVYVANYGCQPCVPNNAPPVSTDQRDQDLLFENLGDGTFADRTDWISHLPATRGLAFAAAWIDFDRDGRLDLYVLNDVRDDQGTSDVMTGRITGDGTTPGNLMIHNDGPGCSGWCFSDATVATGTERRANSMGVAPADYDGDGLEDIFFTNGGFSAGPAALLRNQGDATFEETAHLRNAHLGEWSWGASPIDVDNDGRRDIFVSVGYSDVLQQLPNSQLTEDFIDDAPEQRRRALAEGTARTPWGYVDPPWGVAQDPQRRTDQNRVLLQHEDGSFEVVAVGDGSRLSRVHYGNATADYDRDGWTDVVVGNLGDGYSLLRNRGRVGAGNNRLTVSLRGDGDHVSTDAVGAEVTVTDSSGTRHTDWVRIGTSLGSGSAKELYFGLGGASAERIDVTWPDGTRAGFTGPHRNQRLTIDYGGHTSIEPFEVTK